jgi:hypothetical protein
MNSLVYLNRLTYRNVFYRLRAPNQKSRHHTIFTDLPPYPRHRQVFIIFDSKRDGFLCSYPYTVYSGATMHRAS